MWSAKDKTVEETLGLSGVVDSGEGGKECPYRGGGQRHLSPAPEGTPNHPEITPMAPLFDPGQPATSKTSQGVPRPSSALLSAVRRHQESPTPPPVSP
ncbi:hypothetical protein SAY87_008657 [Trapa incisa]|uniref:Uncharacterized protein n=1 Tax=Trapa incisa TaxID=236973 RepID=A0AAN7JYK2_9MYRT|nr:hypothetical protein SAY87_008657 [Trapa incisa]